MSYARQIVSIHELLQRIAKDLAARSRPGRTESDVQSGLKAFLLAAPLNLEETELDIRLELQAGGRRRIDVEAGQCVFEVKKDLSAGNVLEDAVAQLAGYVKQRSALLGARYVGVLTDGASWRLYRLDVDQLRLVSELTLDPISPDVESLCVWLESILSTAQSVAATPAEVRRRLGAGSPTHQLDVADVAALFAASKGDPMVAVKRSLWARLLTTAFGASFDDSDELFVEHTVLVVTAELLAHAVIGVDPSDSSHPVSHLLSGTLFRRARIGGVVEADFFDWILNAEGGDQVVRNIARRLRRFEWAHVEHDVLKVLYESVIDAGVRHQLGEYYTPDWLAQQVVRDTVSSPLTDRVLDPACGSGTFLFHAVRGILTAAEEAGLSNSEALRRCTALVTGLDVHPVAVLFARVTYLLAIGRDRIMAADRPPFRVPVYLGDSLQWGQEETLFDLHDLVVRASDELELFASELRFPRDLLADGDAFDELVTEMAERASQRAAGTAIPSLSGTFNRLGVPSTSRSTLEATFATMCRLHDAGRDHIWGYYVRNLARPAWLSRPENRVDCIVGNPPWLAYRHMTKRMQAEFKAMAKERGLWSAKGNVSTHADLSGLFVARATQQYLAIGGRFAMVMPNAALSRRQFEGFRRGHWPSVTEPVMVRFDEPWDLYKIRPIFFPQSSCVVRGRRSADESRSMPATAEVWSGQLPWPGASWHEAAPHLVRTQTLQDPQQGAANVGVSPYRTRFKQGATFAPRMLLTVDMLAAGPLGLPNGQIAVRSRRSVSEKAPWKNLEPLDGAIEPEFVRPLFLGESVLHFRTSPPIHAIVPWDSEGSATSAERLPMYPGLEDWWNRASKLWNSNRSNPQMTLLDRINFQKGLSAQVPGAKFRVVYPSSGIHLAGAVVRDPEAVIDTKLYWAAVSTHAEALYLEAMLNSPTLDLRLKPLQSRGKDSPRDIHLYVWQLPVPDYDSTNPGHARLAELAAKAELVAQAVDLRGRDFRQHRQQIRDALAGDGVLKAIDDLVVDLLAVDGGR